MTIDEFLIEDLPAPPEQLMVSNILKQVFTINLN